MRSLLKLKFNCVTTIVSWLACKDEGTVAKVGISADDNNFLMTITVRLQQTIIDGSPYRR